MKRVPKQHWPFLKVVTKHIIQRLKSDGYVWAIGDDRLSDVNKWLASFNKNDYSFEVNPVCSVLTITNPDLAILFKLTF